MTSLLLAVALVAQSAPLADFSQRIQSYVELRARVAQLMPPMRTLPDPAELRRASDALAASMQQARAGARPGDIFTPEIAKLIRQAVGDGCDEDYAALLALVNEDLETPLPRAVVHARWPAGAPLPTMTSDMLVALPRLPQGLEYRFLGGDLVLRDIDANLIVDFVSDVIPPTVPTTHR